MPVREYECQAKKCGEVFEEYEGINDKPLKKCKVCKRGKVIRLISIPARPVVPGDPRDEYNQMKQEAKEIAQKIIRGDEKVINDIYGDASSQGKAAMEQASKVKTLDKVKGGKIKRRS